jgi:hypothetical protein
VVVLLYLLAALVQVRLGVLLLLVLRHLVKVTTAALRVTHQQMRQLLAVVVLAQ